jgi:hypothetical protein
MVTASINTAQTRYYMTTAPAMPKIQLQGVVQGLPAQAKPEFFWSFLLEYSEFIQVPGAFRRNVRTKKLLSIPTAKGNAVTVQLSELMCGKLTVWLDVTFSGNKVRVKRDDIMIGGTNPSSSEIKAAVLNPLVRKLIKQESRGQQFADTLVGNAAFAMNPNWSSDNLRGVGLGQLTPPPTDADIWNWRTNAQSTVKIFGEKRKWATNLHTKISKSDRFVAEATALNDWLVAEGMPRRTITLPALTAAQLDLEGLRGYNGYGVKISGQYYNSLAFEHEPATTILTSTKRKATNGQPLRSPRVLVVDATGSVSWRQISGAERRLRYGTAKSGEPDYVAKVLAQTD